MSFAIRKQNNNYNFYVSHRKTVLVSGIAETREEASEAIFSTIREALNIA